MEGESSALCLGRLDPSWRRVAIVGVAKNSGKTTTLGAVLAASRGAETIGLVSIGVDGEESDLVIGTPKPAIVVEAGDWVATAAGAASSASIEYVEGLGWSTPLGESIVGRVRESGKVMLAGMRHLNDVRHACDRLVHHGAQRVIIDGAYGRISAADAADALIVSTGAVLAPEIEAIVTQTVALTERVCLPAARDASSRALIEAAIARDRALLGVIGEDDRLERIVELVAPSALLGLSRSRDRWEGVRAIAIPGAVTDRVIEELMALGRQKTSHTLIVPSGAHLHASPLHMTRLMRRGWQIVARRSPVLVAISVNPTSPQGDIVDSKALRVALQERVGEAMRVVDVMEGN